MDATCYAILGCWGLACLLGGWLWCLHVPDMRAIWKETK